MLAVAGSKKDLVVSSSNRDWYRKRTYSHFDRPLSKDQATRLVENRRAVAKHAFWPVIINPQKSVSIKKCAKKGGRIYVKKYRPIAFAAHSDSHIYSYYANILSCALESVYEADNGAPHVLAYRKFIPAKSNIHFAQEAFTEIRQRGDCDVIALDVEGFFDTLDHGHLKSAWENLLGFDNLPDDHFAVYKACTNDTAILIPTLRDILKGNLRRRAGLKGSSICTPAEFRRSVKPFLQPRYKLAWKVKRKRSPAKKAGIPQGLPISAVLANIYMLAADNEISRRIKELGGSYRRYSDDILIILPKGKGSTGEAFVTAALSKISLNTQPEKTQRHRFLATGGRLRALKLDDSYNEGVAEFTSYLGFTFDGNAIRLRDSTVSKFMIKARRAVDRAKIAASKKGDKKIKKRQLYARLTMLGYGQAYGDWVYDNQDELWAKGAPPRLGFFKYMAYARKIMGCAALDKQARQIENQVFREISRAEKLG